ncbi:hypothetical protein MPH_08469 [Macrophomina phaseolina MS6]|uniref:Secreted protein n=1 Tax=Macrophomina phaseolina (strain MS6) TaxID=1126212 RepID=K2RNG3_MACPH|nr:hypothetical protein MPH_08469 [Macrophomina phaseolina MS6]
MTRGSSFAVAAAALLPLAAPAAASFAEPEVEYRPKFRYWLPDASVPPATVQSDIAAIASIGAGGIELLGYYQYGLPEAEQGVAPPTDWTLYGFGTPAFKEIFYAALQSSSDNGLVMDFAQGANQGQGVPSEPETEGLAVELAYANVTVEAGATWEGILPESEQPSNPFASFMHSPEEFGAQRLLAVQAVQVVGASEEVAGAGGFSSTLPIVIFGEVVDLTAEVGEDRSLNWTAPTGNSTWRIIAWYERYTNQKSCSGGLNATDYIGNGSWTVDHFSANGSKKLTDFFDEHVIGDAETRELLASVGKYGWEDSMEMVSSLWWTPDLPSRFNSSRGYDITVCLPYLITPANYWNGAVVPYGEGFTSENAAFAEKCNEDYRTTLNEGYQDYLSAFVDWSHGVGVEYSAQPAYNLPLNMLDDIAILDAPEGESLGFSNIIDTYRQFSGPAHLAGISVVSSECGALSGAPYQQTLNDLLWSVRRGLSTGISMNVLHGFAYSGPYANTTWPSYTTFTYRFSEMWNHHQPSWVHMNDSIKYIARNQFVSQTGTPSVDLAFYQYNAPWTVEQQYMDDNLETLGYTYEYLSSGNLQTPEAVVEDGVLAPSGPSYKALIFSNQTALTPGAAAKVQEFATAGLPIFFVGATSFTSIGQESGAAEDVSSTISAIVDGGLKNVHTVASSADLPVALSSAGIVPKVSFSDATSWYPFWRRADGIEYAYIYNDDLSTQTVDVTFATTGTPYVFNAWTGSVTPVLQYTTTATGITIPITLASNQTTILGFVPANSTSSDYPATPSMHVTSSSGAVAGLTSSSSTNGTPSLSAYLTGAASFTLSDGSTRDLSASPPAATNLTTWDIVIQDWHRTSDPFSMDTAITYHNYTSTALAAWKDLDAELAGVSGIGRYTTTFSYPSSANDSAPLGALLSFGPVTNTIRAWVNGELLPPIDITHAVADVSGFVRDGENELVVEVTTTLFNRIKADGNSTWSVGVTANEQNSAYYEVNDYKEYGLLGPVVVQWVGIVDVV